MEMKESKLSCKLCRHGVEVDGVIHLFELTYDAGIVFWNGVVQVCPEISQVGKFAPNADFGIRLEDGRQGFCVIVHIAAKPGYCHLAIVGKPNRD